MNSITCHASACRCTATRRAEAAATAAERPARPGCARTDFSCGSHSSPASAAGAASQPRVSSSEPPLPCHSGTLTTEPVIAPTDSAVM